MTAIWTIGHSTRTSAEFTDLLHAHGVEALADVRSFPGSRRCPWFGAGMSGWLAEAHVGYVWLPDLGGRRGKQDVDPALNGAWTNPSFRNYADWTTSETFAAGLAELERMATERRVAFMCSEAVPWRCHRTLISDALVARSWDVLHILDGNDAKPHRLGAWGPTPVVKDGRLTYPAAQMSLGVAS